MLGGSFPGVVAYYKMMTALIYASCVCLFDTNLGETVAFGIILITTK